MNTAIKRKNDNSPQRPPRSRDFVLLVEIGRAHV